MKTSIQLLGLASLKKLKYNTIPSEAPTLYRHILTLDDHNGQDGLGTSQNGQNANEKENHNPLVIVVANSVIVLVKKLEAKHVAAVAKRTIFPRRARATPLPRT